MNTTQIQLPPEQIPEPETYPEPDPNPFHRPILNRLRMNPILNRQVFPRSLIQKPQNKDDGVIATEPRDYITLQPFFS